MKRSSFIREYKLKVKWDYIACQLDGLKFNSLITPSVDKEAEQQEYSNTAGDSAK